MVLRLATVLCNSGNPRFDRMAILSRQPLGQSPKISSRILRPTYRFSNKSKKSVRHALETLEPATALETVHVRVVIKLSVMFGEHLCLVGSCEELGSWNVERAPKFQWTHGDVWVADVELPSDTSAEFKVVHVVPSTGEYIWEYTNNRVLEVPDVKEMKDGELSLTWCDESVDASMVRPVKMSSMASWDEDDEQSAAGPFSSVLDFFAEDKPVEVIGEPIEDNMNTEDSVKELMEAVDENPDTFETTLESTGYKDTSTSEVLSDGTVDMPEDYQENIENLPDTVETQGTSSLKKAATAAGMVAAGVAGAALLSGLAIDVADTAVLGAFAVAAGSAAFGTKSSGKTGDGEDEKALSKEPGTIIAAGLAAAFDQTKSKTTDVKDDTTVEENE